MTHSGMVWGDQTCACDASDSPGESHFPSSRKYSITMSEPIMNDLDGISNKPSDPWFTDFFVEGNNEGQGSSDE